MTSMPVGQRNGKADLFQELQQGPKPDIVERLLGNKVTAKEVAGRIIPGEALMGQKSQQIIL
jgi:hypothetical protein